MRINRNYFPVLIHLIYFHLLLFIFVSNALSWSSVDTVEGFATHQFFNRQAYDALRDHPAFKRVHFPSLEKIQLYSGITTSQTGLGPDGNGPDGKANTKFTEHYYNPRNRNGYAPKSINRLHEDLTEKMGAYTAYKAAPDSFINESAKMAAYAAHFLQDLTCPMHVSGMHAGLLDKNHPGLSKDNSPYSPDYTSREWKILVERFTKYRLKNNKKNFARIDFFDPLYYDGYLSNPNASFTDYKSIETGTHFQYELQVETKYHMTKFVDPKANWALYKNRGYIPGNYSKGLGIEKLAIETAKLTRSRIGTKKNPGPLWFVKNETIPFPTLYNISRELMNDKITVPYEDWWRAVQLTYALWRSSFTALYIKKENIRLEGLPDQPDLFLLSVKVSNLEPIVGKVKDINVVFETTGGVLARGSLSYTKGLSENGETGWLKFRQPVLIENPNQISAEILFTVSGKYPDNIPDSGKREIGYNLSVVKVVPPEKKEEKKDDVNEKKQDDEKDKQGPDEPEKKDDKKPTAVSKDDYVIKAIAIETENVIRDNKTYSKVDNIDAAVVIIRMRGTDHIIDGYDALNLLIEKGYVYSVQGVGLVTSERFVDFMVEGIDKSLLNQSDEEDNRPAFVKNTTSGSDGGHEEPSDAKPTPSDSNSSTPPSSRDWRDLNDNEFVNRLYESILDRSPDKGGFNHWLQLLKSGRSRESIIQWFFKSPEYKSRNKSDHDFIIDLYQALYGRNPTSAELSQSLNSKSIIGSKDQFVSQNIASTVSNDKTTTTPCPENTKRCKYLFMKGRMNLTKSELSEYDACSKRAEEIKACKKSLKKK